MIWQRILRPKDTEKAQALSQSTRFVHQETTKNGFIAESNYARLSLYYIVRTDSCQVKQVVI
jgi:hypothetical protein